MMAWLQVVTSSEAASVLAQVGPPERQSKW